MIPFAYVTGTFYTASGASRANERITFQPLSTPYVVDGEVVLSVPLLVTLDSNGKIHDGNGNFHYKLAKGFYRVVASDTDAFNIEVPDDQADHEVASLTTEVNPSPVIGVQQILTPRDVFNTVENSDTMAWSNAGPAHSQNSKIVFFGELGDVSDEDYFYRWSSEVGVSPQFILGNANPGGSDTTFETSLFQWSSYVTLPASSLYYALGTEDYSNPSGLSEILLNYTQIIPDRYYKVETGPTVDSITHVFVMDSNDECPDGNTASSTQALWLRDQLAASTARWKIVCFQESPITATLGKGNPAMNWPFKTWGADVVIAAGAKTTEYRTLDDGTPLFVIGTSGKGPYDPLNGDIGPEQTSMTQNHNRQALVVDITEAQLTVIAANVPNGSRWAQVSIYGKPDRRISISPKFEWDSGFTVHSPLGSGLRPEPWGSAQFRNSVGRFAEYVVSQNYGTIVRVTTLPTPNQVRANPMLKHCLFIKDTGSAVLELYAWMPVYSDFRVILSEVVDVGSPVATQQLSVPVITYDNASSSLGATISHETNGVTIWVSLDFGPFTAMPSWPDVVYFSNPKSDTPSVISTFASKSGYIDSPIVSQAFAQDVEQPILIVGNPW